MRRSDLVRNPGKGKAVRTSQIVFGERQHLLRVLDSVERSALPAARLDQERRVIEQLIHARTQELNRINEGWDEKVGTVLSSEVKAEALDQAFAASGPKGRLLPAPFDQRASESDGEDFGSAVAPSVFRDSREYRAASQ